MGSDEGQIFPTASLHRDHSISYALVCEKALSHIGKKERKSRSGVREIICHFNSMSDMRYIFLLSIFVMCDSNNIFQFIYSKEINPVFL